MSDGVDLFQVEGVSFHLVLTLLSEVGTDLSAFPTANHFVSWLCLCPNKKVTGGKILSSKTRKNKSLLRQAFKQAAIAVAKNKESPLANFYRKRAALNGKGTAITATARKLALIVYNMIQNKQPYLPQSSEEHQEKVRKLKIKQIQKTIAKLELKESELFALSA
jgi:transposase